MLCRADNDRDDHEEESQPASILHAPPCNTNLATEKARPLAVVYLLSCRRTGTQGDAVLHWLLGGIGRCIGFRRVQDD